MQRDNGSEEHLSWVRLWFLQICCLLYSSVYLPDKAFEVTWKPFFFFLSFFFQNYWSAARLTVTMLHLWRFTTLRPSWGGGESYFISEEQVFFWHRENEHLSNKTGYCYLENTRILYGDANPLKNSSGRHMKWYDSQIHGFAFVRECLSFLHWKATLCCNTSEKRKHVT